MIAMSRRQGVIFVTSMVTPILAMVLAIVLTHNGVVVSIAFVGGLLLGLAVFVIGHLASRDKRPVD